MTKIQRNRDCGNSPKNHLLLGLTVAIARADTAQILQYLATGVEWSPIGRQPISGVDAVCRALTRYGPATSLEIAHVLSHGRSGAVDGVVAFGSKKRAFCHVYEFGNAKGVNVSGITTYSVPVK